MGRPKPVPQPAVHERVAQQVHAAELSNGELAKLTGWSEQRVWRLLTGRTELTASDMETLAKILRRPVAELYRIERAQ